MSSFIRNFIEYSGIDDCPYDKLTNFKEIIVDNTFCIAIDKPTISELIKVNASATIDNYQIVQTPDFRTLLSGTIKMHYEYCANNLTQTVNSANTTIAFSDFIVLPANFNSSATILPMVSIKDISSNTTSTECIYTSVTLMLAIENCG